MKSLKALLLPICNQRLIIQPDHVNQAEYALWEHVTGGHTGWVEYKCAPLMAGGCQ